MTVAIDLWLWSLDCAPDEATRRSVVLNEAERARAARFVHDRDRLRFISGRWRLRGILAGIVGCSPAALPLREVANGKPELAEGPLFNLSHAAGLAALVVTHEAGVLLGVDIEGARQVDPGLDAYAFAPEERAALRVTANENREMRMQEAERKAASLPAKLTVPMIIFFLPCLFAVIMGPAIMSIKAALH